MWWTWFALSWKTTEKPIMSDTHQKQILVVDDEEAILKLLTKVLIRNGYRIDTADNGEEAIKKSRSADTIVCSLILLMPGLSGSDVAATAKTLYGDSVPIIGMSGTPWLLDCSLFDDTVEKPCSIIKLIHTIQKMVP